MDELANNVLATLKKSAASADAKVNAVNNLKVAIKHQRVSESAQGPTLDCLRLAITSQSSPTLVAAGLSTLGHLIKRLTIQDQTAALFSSRVNLLPVLLERLCDQKETQRAAAVQLFADLWPSKQMEIEKVIKEGAIQGNHVRAKIAGMQWVAKMHEEQSLQFRSFVPPMVECLEDADGMVRESAKIQLVELFRTARDAAKADLRKQLIAYNVRKSIAEHILSQLSIPIPTELSLNTSTSTSMHPQTPMVDLRTTDGVPEPSLPPSAEITTIEPLNVYTKTELEDLLRAMASSFEGRESEDNWKARDNNVLKIRRLLKGNAPQDHHAVFCAEVKNLLDGILKVANSLRTTMSTNGCQLAQELARTLGTAIDPMAEILLRGFEKMCAATKHIAAQNGNLTMDTIFAYSSYSTRHMQQVFTSAGDKNVQPRQFAAGWLKTLLKKQIHNKSHFEHSGGLEIAEKTIKKGLNDANPKVREVMRSTYWIFAQTWPDRAEVIMGTLDVKSKQLLEKDSSNPNGPPTSNTFTASVGPMGAVNPRAPVPARVALKDAIAAQRNAAKRMPDRPTSAMSSFTPSRAVPSSASRPAAKLPGTAAARERVVSTASSQGSVRGTAALNVSSSTGQNSLMGAPVRRPKRPDMPRPATADPYNRRNNDAHEDTPPRSPIATPQVATKQLGTGRTAGHQNSKSTTTMGAAITSNSITSSKVPSPRTSPIKAKSKTGLPGPQTTTGSSLRFDTSSPSSREDNFTMIVPDGKALHRTPHSTSRSKNYDTERPHSGHSSLLGTVDEDNFTLVIPDRSAYRFPNAIPGQIGAEYRVKLDSDDRNDGSLMVYEDSLAEDVVVPTEEAPVVLEEKPMNEQNVLPAPPPSQPSTGSPSSSPPQPRPEDQNHQRPRSTSPTKRPTDPRSASPLKRPTTAPSNSDSPLADRAEVLKVRRLLASGAERVRARTLDAHGFRRLQDLIRTHAQTPDVRFGPLLAALVESLRSPSPIPDAIKQSNGSMSMGLKGQALGAVKAIVTLYARRDEEVREMIPSVLTGLAQAAGIWESDRIGGSTELEKAAEEVIKKVVGMGMLASERSTLLDHAIRALGDIVDESISASRSQTKTTALALTILARLVPRIIQTHSHVSNSSIDNSSNTHNLPIATRTSLSQLSVRALTDLDADVRRKGVELALELYAAFPSPGKSERAAAETRQVVQFRALAGKGEFWALMRPAGEQSCNLLAYYLARRGRGGDA